MSSDTEFDLFKISEDHEALREAVRAVAEDKIAPHAAEVDEKSEFPRAALAALVASDFHAPHIAEQYDGVGADALATCIVNPDAARAPVVWTQRWTGEHSRALLLSTSFTVGVVLVVRGALLLAG